MTYPNTSAMNAYRATGAASQVAAANPHRLVQLALEGIGDRLSAARGHMERGRTAEKGAAISRALALIDELNTALDLERGGTLAANLRALYDYATRRLVEANLHNDPRIVAEVQALIREVKVGWDAIADAPRDSRP